MDTQNEEGLPPSCHLCIPQLLDALTVAIGFMPDPSPFRGCNRYTFGVWTQALYLEGFLPCAYTTGEHGHAPLPCIDCTGTTVIIPTVQGAKIPSIVIKGFPKLLDVSQWVPYSDPANNLTEVVFQDLPELTSLAQVACMSMERITLRNLPKLTQEPGLTQSYNLRMAVFENLPELVALSSHTMNDCPALGSVTLRGLPKLSTVGNGVLARTRLSHFEFEAGGGFPSLKTVGNSWLACTSLKRITIDGTNFPQLSTVGDSWLGDCAMMCGCASLETFTLRDMLELKRIGNEFLRGCPSLKEAEFVNLPELFSVGTAWMLDCPELGKVVFHGLPNLEEVGTEDLLGGMTKIKKWQVTFDPSKEFPMCHPNLHVAVEAAMQKPRGKLKTKSAKHSNYVPWEPEPEEYLDEYGQWCTKERAGPGAVRYPGRVLPPAKKSNKRCVVQ